MTIHPSIDLGAAIPRMDITGVAVASLSWGEAIGLLRDLIVARRFTKVAFLNAHNSNVAYSNGRLRTALGHALVLPDGVGVDIAAKFLHGEPFAANLNGTDFIPALLEEIAKPLRVGLLGAQRANVEAAARNLGRIASQHTYLVVGDGYFPEAAEEDVLAMIEESRLDVLLTAMGTPRQEIFVSERIAAQVVPVSISVGALFDFLAGAVPRAPQWMRTFRLEWVFRLVLEPSRLWRRYLLGNPVFLYHVFLQKLQVWRNPA